MLNLSTSPHMYSKQTTGGIMLDVIIALIPALFMGILLFGIQALTVCISAVTSCVVFEYLLQKYALKQKPQVNNLSAAVTGLLLAFNLPCNIPLILVLIASFVAIGIAKLAYGGLGKNIFNPALVGRVFLFIAFPAYMSSWPKPRFMEFFNTDAVTSATPLNVMKYTDAATSATKLSNIMPDYIQMFLGDTGGCLGETSALALLLGFAYLLYKKVIKWHIPVVYICTVFMLFAIFYIGTGNAKYDPLAQSLSGGLMLGAIFMATDYTTSPMTNKGKIIFALGCGVLTFVIREYSSYPEGVSFAILIMNAFVPLIDRFCLPHLFGTRRK